MNYDETPLIVESAIKLGAQLIDHCNYVGTDGKRIIVYVESYIDLIHPLIPTNYDGFDVYTKIGSIPSVKLTCRD